MPAPPNSYGTGNRRYFAARSSSKSSVKEAVFPVVGGGARSKTREHLFGKLQAQLDAALMHSR